MPKMSEERLLINSIINNEKLKKKSFTLTVSSVCFLSGCDWFNATSHNCDTIHSTFSLLGDTDIVVDTQFDMRMQYFNTSQEHTIYNID